MFNKTHILCTVVISRLCFDCPSVVAQKCPEHSKVRKCKQRAKLLAVVASEFLSCRNNRNKNQVAVCISKHV